ncbi:hypothetical protein KGQ29_04585 [Patescibacteria group bacterium]|nr:hypothetical protein [Patescibacteria group bacterium]
MTQNDKNYDSVDLSGMLKNSRPTVEFEEYGISRSYRDSSADTPKIIRLVIRYSGGLIKDGKQASFVLLGFAAVAIIISAVLLLDAGVRHSPPPLGGPLSPLLKQ